MSEAVFRVAKEWDVVTIKLSKLAEEHRDKMLNQERCMGCERKLERDDEGKLERVTCGLCVTCYNAVLRREQKNKRIRQELIREGRMLPATEGGRRPANEFTRQLAEK